MLPFLKKDKEASVSGPVSSIKREHDEDHEVDYDILESAAQDLIDALEKKDVNAVAIALRAAFEICDAAPHEEGEHEEIE